MRCPYCDVKVEDINPAKEIEQCKSCGNIFRYTVQPSSRYVSYKADCLNALLDHDLELVRDNRYACKICRQNFWVDGK